MLFLYVFWVVFGMGFMTARHTIEPEYPYGTRLALRHCVVDKVEIDRWDSKEAIKFCAEQTGRVSK